MGSLDDFTKIEELNDCGQLDISHYILAVFRGHLYATEKEKMRKITCYEIFATSLRKKAEKFIENGAIYRLAATEDSLYALIREDKSNCELHKSTFYNLWEMDGTSLEPMRKLDTNNVSKEGQWLISATQQQLLLMVLVYDKENLQNELNDFLDGRWIRKINLPSFPDSRPHSFQCRGDELSTLIIGYPSKVVHYRWSQLLREFSKVWEVSAGQENYVIIRGDRLIVQAEDTRNWQVTEINDDDPRHSEYPAKETQPLIGISLRTVLARRGPHFYLMELTQT